MPGFRFVIPWLCLLGLLLPVVSVALAEDPPTTKQQATPAKLEIGLTVIVAGTGDAYIDPRIRDTAAKLAALFPYTRYERKSLILETKTLGEAFRVRLPGNREFLATAQAKTEKDQFKLLVEIPALLKTELRLSDGGQVILGGPTVQDGVLVLVLSAQSLPMMKSATPSTAKEARP